MEPLPVDTREATSMRERLDIHRKNQACYSCHAKIDPMGFAFENFGVVGRWRDRYKRAKEPIDTSATMANGKRIADIVEFKEMLTKRQRKPVVSCLTKKLLTYATGRHLESVDRGEVDRIVAEAEKKKTDCVTSSTWSSRVISSFPNENNQFPRLHKVFLACLTLLALLQAEATCPSYQTSSSSWWTTWATTTWVATAARPSSRPT